MEPSRTIPARHDARRRSGHALVVTCACLALVVPTPVASAASATTPSAVHHARSAVHSADETGVQPNRGDDTARPLAQAGLGSLPSLLLPSVLVLVLGSVAMVVTALRNSRR